MPTVPVFLDFACPWSYSARNREKQLARELDVTIEYLPWELNPGLSAEGKANPYAQPSEELLAFARASATPLKPRAWVHNTHRLLAGLFFARAHGRYDAYVDRAFKAYWEEQADVNDPAVLRTVARDSGLDPDAFLASATASHWDPHFLAVDAWAEALGVKSTVTYVLPGGTPRIFQGLGDYEDLRQAVKRSL